MTPELLLETIVKAIVRNPDSVEIEKVVDDMGTFLKLKVHKTDMGLVLGKQGAHSNAIKLIAKLCGMNNSIRVAVKIIEPDNV